MADAPRTDPIHAAQIDLTLQERINTLRSRLTQRVQETTYEGELSDTNFTADDYKAVRLTAINGASELPEQKVAVEYLASNQKLLIPYALVMVPSNQVAAEREVPLNAEIAGRYLRVAACTYAELRTMMFQKLPPATVRTQIGEKIPVTLEAGHIYDGWSRDEYYYYADGHRDEPEYAAQTFAFISQALQLNCDVRDIGKLSYREYRVADNAWKDITAVTRTRLSVKFKCYTMLCLAALNFVPAGRHGLPAWVRAYGVGTGILPSRNSRFQKEYKFTMTQPFQDDRSQVVRYDRDSQTALYPLCMNIIAMFGLLHLNKDHTYRSDDSNMLRICDSYIESLQSIVYDHRTDEMKQVREHVCRTAAHPFGLGQTYFVARVMGKFSNLAAPLAFRLDVTPPPIQRFMVVNAAVDEWTSLPVGKILNQVYSQAIATIKDEIRKIRANPPAYSGLHDLYGELQMEKPGTESISAVESLMPNVYGFAMTWHTDEQNQKDGIALALSLMNFKRDRKALAHSFENLWRR